MDRCRAVNAKRRSGVTMRTLARSINEIKTVKHFNIQRKRDLDHRHPSKTNYIVSLLRKNSRAITGTKYVREAKAGIR